MKRWWVITYRRCCDGCLRRTIHTKEGDRIQYYHRDVAIPLVCEDGSLLLDTDRYSLTKTKWLPPYDYLTGWSMFIRVRSMWSPTTAPTSEATFSTRFN